MTQTIQLRLGDCTEVTQGMPGCQVGAIVTDPPYGLEFMGKSWDKLEGQPEGWTPPFLSDGGSDRLPLPRHSGKTLGCKRDKNQQMQEWHLQWLKECYRVLRPGGVIKVFSATRTFHRLAAAMEDAGFFLDPEHSIEAWSFGSGFPKYLNTSKAIDAHLGKTHERPVVGTSRGVAVADNQGFGGIARGAVGIKQVGVDLDKTSAATPEAARFDGWATALKPGWEPFLVGMKPHD